MIKALLETGFLISLNPKDKNHGWAMEILKDARERRIRIFISPVSPIELSLILKSRGLKDDDLSQVFDAIDSIVKHLKPSHPDLTFECVALAAKLRSKYQQLSFFDSLHAAVTLTEDLVYYDLDDVIRSVVESERK